MMEEDFLQNITKTIVDRFDPRRIVLFDSRARRQSDSDSDLDLFLEMKTERRLPERAIEVSSAFGLRAGPMDIIVYTPKEVERLRHIQRTLLSVVEKEGKILYERA